MKNKHLALISSDKKPGGISNMIGIHSAALLNEGYKLSVILPNNSDSINSIENCIKDIKIKNYDITIYKFDWLDNILLKLAHSQWISKILNKVDACFVHNARLIPTIKKKSLIPVFAVNHTAKLSQLKYYNQANIIFSVNKNINTQLINSGVSKNKCVYCPNVLLSLPDLSKDQKPNKNIVIGALGRMVEKKGFFDFIDALKILKKKGFSFKAVLAGHGELYEKLKHASQDLPELDFPGWISDKKTFFDKIDIFCQPSHFEPFGLTVIEAMANAKPVISTNCDGPIEIINNDGKNGLLVPQKNPEKMAKAIIELIQNPEIQKNMSVAARKHIKKYYSLASLQNILDININNYFQSEHDK